MSTRDTLILSGLLYEGNFNEWLPRMLALLQIRGVTIVRQEGRYCVPDYKVARDFKKLAPKDIKDIILGQVSPGFLPRLSIPRSGNKSTDRLLCRLESIA